MIFVCCDGPATETQRKHKKLHCIFSATSHGFSKPPSAPHHFKFLCNIWKKYCNEKCNLHKQNCNTNPTCCTKKATGTTEIRRSSLYQFTDIRISCFLSIGRDSRRAGIWGLGVPKSRSPGSPGFFHGEPGVPKSRSPSSLGFFEIC